MIYTLCQRCVDLARTLGLPTAALLTVLHPFLHGTPLDVEYITPFLLNKANEEKPV